MACFLRSTCRSLQRNCFKTKRLFSQTATSSDEIFLNVTETGDEQGIAVMTLNRPTKANAISKSMFEAFKANLQRIRADRDIRVVIVASSNPKYFSAGADLKERVGLTEHEVSLFVSDVRSAMNQLADLPQPTIAAIEGIAYGGGLELALACDIRVASSSAKLGLVETRLAIIPGAGGTQRLTRAVGLSRAKQLIFSASVVSGEEAAAINLVNTCVKQNEAGNAALEEARSIAKQINIRGPVAVRMAKIAMNRGYETDLATGLAIEEACYAQVIPTEDRYEALKAFMANRQPKYSGR